MIVKAVICLTPFLLWYLSWRFGKANKAQHEVAHKDRQAIYLEAQQERQNNADLLLQTASAVMRVEGKVEEAAKILQEVHVRVSVLESAVT